jgi:hypothetical protein
VAQTTTAVIGVQAKVEISADGTDWDDISGSVAAIEPGDAARQSGESYTLDGDTAILGGGKREPHDIEVRLLYTPTTGEAFELARAIYETPGSACYLRWSPAGGGAGSQEFTTVKGVMTRFLYPKGASDDAAPVPGGFTVRTPYTTASTVEGSGGGGGEGGGEGDE